MKTFNSFPRIFVSIIGLLGDCLGFYQFFTTNSNLPMDINYTWLIISCALTILLVIFYFYWKISDKILALKKFRDKESLYSQRYSAGIVAMVETQIKKAYSTMNHNWERGEVDSLSKIWIDGYSENMTIELEEYNKAFPECKPFTPYESK